MEQDAFVGAWSSISYEARTADGEVNHPLGRDAEPSSHGGRRLPFGGRELTGLALAYLIL